MTTVNVTRGDTTIVRIITAGPQGPAGGGGGGGTDLSYDAATRTIASSTGTDAVLPVATIALAGLESAADKAKLESITVDSATLVRKYVRNTSGISIPRGAAVYQTGSSGTTITVALADASAEATAAQTLGLAQETIAHNANGYVVAVGLLDGISTAALTEGQIVWLSETAGEGTSTRPTQPAHGVVLGYCVKQGPGTSGILYVKVDNGLELEELHDVLIVGATAGQVLRRASDGLWKNAQLAASDLSGLGGAATLNVGTTAGTVAAGDDSRITGALSAATAATTYQPLDADLTSIAALTTTTFGRSLLTQADAAAARTTLGAGTGNGTVTGVTATGLLTSSGGTAPQISSSIATNSLAGRFSAGTGALEAITIGSGLAISGGALVVTAGGTGTVTSVGLSLPGIFSVAGSPVTTAGTLAATLATQAANLIFAGPSSGAAAAPTFRALVTADLPGVIQVATELTLPLNAPGSPTARDIYAVADTVRYRDSANAERLLLNATDNLANLSNTTTARSNIGAAASGAIGSSGLTMATARLLGRTTASTGAPEEITVGSGLSLSAGTLTATGGGGASFAGYAVNNYVIPTTGALGAGNAVNANQIALMPFTVLRAITVSELAARVTTAAAGIDFQLAVYGSDSGLPTGTAIMSTASLSAGTVGIVQGTVTAATLQPGVLYWQAVNANGTPTFVSVAANNAYQSSIVGSTTLSEILASTGTTFHSRIITGQTFGTWPDLTGVSSIVPTSSQRRVPVFAFLVSALP